MGEAWKGESIKMFVYGGENIVCFVGGYVKGGEQEDRMMGK